MTSHRSYAASFVFAAFISTTALGGTASQSDVTDWSQSVVKTLSSTMQVDVKWQKIKPKYVQPGHDANRKDVWLVRLIDPAAGPTDEQNLYLILSETGELIEFSDHLPSHYLINKN